MNTQVTVFLSHGSPLLAIEDSPAGRFLDGLGTALPRPRAIVVASAHYLATTPRVGAALQPATVHDFGGFPEPLYRIEYPARGEPALAQRIAALAQAAGLTLRLDAERGLDHGIWVPVRRMYPQGEVPVVPLSVNPYGTAAEHYRLGQVLTALRADGVLVLGSGGFVHNLGDLDWRHPDAPMPDWAARFADWMRARLAAGDHAALLDWQRQAPHAARAHPTVEHLMPLFVALGAAGAEAPVRVLHRSHEFGSLALDAFAFG